MNDKNKKHCCLELVRLRDAVVGKCPGDISRRCSSLRTVLLVTCLLVVGTSWASASYHSFESRRNLRQAVEAAETVAAEEDWTDEKTRGAEQKKNQDPTADSVLGMEFVQVAPGTFDMGSDSSEANFDEKPVHKVRISRRFWIGKYEVTQQEYKQLIKENPSRFKGDDKPVEKVSWYDAMEFCKKLTEQERDAGRLPDGYVYRLPTEAEWEYAARGGQQSNDYKYAGSDDVNEVAWYEENSGGETQPVGRKKTNELGLYDMSGNVWEWCYDWHDPKYYSKSPDTDPVNTTPARFRIWRGGSWHTSHPHARSSIRRWYPPDYTFEDLGFRVVLAPSISPGADRVDPPQQDQLQASNSIN